jgi:hypothetical protein
MVPSAAVGCGGRLALVRSVVLVSQLLRTQTSRVHRLRNSITLRGRRFDAAIHGHAFPPLLNNEQAPRRRRGRGSAHAKGEALTRNYPGCSGRFTLSASSRCHGFFRSISIRSCWWPARRWPWRPCSPLPEGASRGSVDRRFNRARYDAEHIVAAFAARLRAEVGPGRGVGRPGKSGHRDAAARSRVAVAAVTGMATKT